VPPWPGRGKREGEKSRREEEDDRRGRLVSERKEGERELGRPGLAGPSKRAWLAMSERAWLGRASGWAKRERRRGSRPVLKFCFFFLKNVNSISFWFIAVEVFVKLQKY
jgi:hypothetical protein